MPVFAVAKPGKTGQKYLSKVLMNHHFKMADHPHKPEVEKRHGSQDPDVISYANRVQTDHTGNEENNNYDRPIRL